MPARTPRPPPLGGDEDRPRGRDHYGFVVDYLVEALRKHNFAEVPDHHFSLGSHLNAISAISLEIKSAGRPCAVSTCSNALGKRPMTLDAGANGCSTGRRVRSSTNKGGRSAWLRERHHRAGRQPLSTDAVLLAAHGARRFCRYRPHGLPRLAGVARSGCEGPSLITQPTPPIGIGAGTFV